MSIQIAPAQKFAVVPYAFPYAGAGIITEMDHRLHPLDRIKQILASVPSIQIIDLIPPLEIYETPCPQPSAAQANDKHCSRAVKKQKEQA
jgi:hypothetical protein